MNFIFNYYKEISQITFMGNRHFILSFCAITESKITFLRSN